MVGNLDIVYRGRIVKMWESVISVREIARCIPCCKLNVRKWMAKRGSGEIKG